MQDSTSLNYIYAILFALAVLHTFSVGFFLKWAEKFPEGSWQENLLHFLGEVEVVFGVWAAIFFLVYTAVHGFKVVDTEGHLIGGSLFYLENLNFTEPVFVFVVMSMAATRPIIVFARETIDRVASLLPMPKKIAFFMTTLIAGPLLGSFITEPAAMTLVALTLRDYFFSDDRVSEKFKYAVLGLLFVNISIGGTLTSFAAPPVLMVAGRWGWDFTYMMNHFGIKAIAAIIIATALVAFLFLDQLKGPLRFSEKRSQPMAPRPWITIVHLFFLGLAVYSSHHLVFVISIFLFFIGFVSVTQEYQEELKIKEALMVSFFLAGLIVLGSAQSWWLKPVVVGLQDWALFFGATGLTAVTDNAALTYLGSLVELSESAKYNLVAGAVAGGGLTVIANAPNPAGYSILHTYFKGGTIHPMYLFLAALGPTLIVILCFQLLPTISMF